MITFNRLRKNTTLNLRNIRVKTYTVMAVTLFVVLILAAFAIRPVIFKLSDEIGTYNTLKAQNNQLQAALTTLASDTNVYNTQVSGNTDTLNTALPDAPQTGPLFANIEAIAQSHQVTINSIKFLKGTDSLDEVNLGDRQVVTPPGTSALYFVSNGDASYNNVLAFIKDLEQYPRIFNLVQVTLTTDTASQNAQSFVITGYVYYMNNI